MAAPISTRSLLLFWKLRQKMPDAPRGVDSLPPHRPAEWLLVFVQLPNQPARRAGVLLLDIASDKLFVALADGITDQEPIAEVWDLLKDDLEARAAEVGGAALLNSLQKDLSHFLQITDRRQISIADPKAALAELMQRHVLNSPGLAQAT